MNLKFLKGYIKQYLDDSSQMLLDEIHDKMNAKINSQRNKGPIVWKISITRERPLTFKESSEGRFSLHIDLSCDIEGNVDSLNSHQISITKYNVSVRIWSHQKEISYRKGIDDPRLQKELENLNWRRVISRWHMDLREVNTQKPEPLYHLHFGGRIEDIEYCWFPEKLEEPRFCCFPMDLVLLCEFILVNFFPKESADLRKKPEWKKLVRKSQHLYVNPYFDQLKKFLNNDSDTLLGHLSTYKRGGGFISD
jgi:hypothetical protein